MQRRPTVTTDTLAKWQFVVNQISEITSVPATLIMHKRDKNNDVFVRSSGDENPYFEGQSFQFNNKLYCYGVLENDGELCVRDATRDPRWEDNADLEHDMSFYIGLPLKWPDGGVFGTICMLDRQENEHALAFRTGLGQFRQIVEDDLAMLAEIQYRKTVEFELQEQLISQEELIKKRTRDLEEANTALRVLVKGMETSKSDVEDRVVQQIKGLVLPYIGQLQHLNAHNERAISTLDIVAGNLKNITSSFSGRLAQALDGLTPTEAEIAQLIAQGRSTKEIADVLSRGTSTIDFHRNNIRTKLGLKHQGKNLQQYLAGLA